MYVLVCLCVTWLWDWWLFCVQFGFNHMFAEMPAGRTFSTTYRCYSVTMLGDREDVERGGKSLLRDPYKYNRTSNIPIYISQIFHLNAQHHCVVETATKLLAAEMRKRLNEIEKRDKTKFCHYFFRKTKGGKKCFPSSVWQWCWCCSCWNKRKTSNQGLNPWPLITHRECYYRINANHNYRGTQQTWRKLSICPPWQRDTFVH